MNTLYLVQFLTGSTAHPVRVHAIAPSEDSARILAQAERIQRGAADYQVQTVEQVSDAAQLNAVFAYLGEAPRVIDIEALPKGPPLKKFRVEIWNSIEGPRFVTGVTKEATDADTAMDLAAQEHIQHIGRGLTLLSHSNKQRQYRYFARMGETLKDNRPDAQLFVGIPR